MKSGWIVGAVSLFAVGVIAGAIRSPSDERTVPEATLPPIQDTVVKDQENVLPSQTEPTFYSLGTDNTLRYHLELIHSTEFLAPGDLVDVHPLGPDGTFFDHTDLRRVQVSNVSATGVELIVSMNEMHHLAFFEGHSFRFMLAKRHLYGEALSCHDLEWKRPHDPDAWCGTETPHPYELESKRAKKYVRVTIDVSHADALFRRRDTTPQRNADKARGDFEPRLDVLFIPSPKKFEIDRELDGSGLMKIKHRHVTDVGRDAVEILIEANDVRHVVAALQLGKLRVVVPVDGFAGLNQFNVFESQGAIKRHDSPIYKDIHTFRKAHPPELFKERNVALKKSLDCRAP